VLAVVRDLQFAGAGAFALLSVVLTWHIETRLSQPRRREIRIRIRKHSDLFPVRPAVWTPSASTCALCARLAGPGPWLVRGAGRPRRFSPFGRPALAACCCARRSFSPRELLRRHKPKRPETPPAQQATTAHTSKKKRKAISG
jgi:hypothetical protein